ncbi:MAG TPA: hypothetical protein VG271_14310 [Beijerinckiaceae bacterium]|nr:hypothetical protein [Beijerinckiaceae bacterium]
MAEDRAARIRALNDQLRQHRCRGKIMVTLGIVALGSNVQDRILERITGFEGWISKTGGRRVS